MAKPLEIDHIWQERILNQINGLEYGQVIITVHDGRIVQIDRTERTRYEAAPVKKQSPAESPSSVKTSSARGSSGRAVEGDSLRAVQ